ncbi:hypothetical protein [Sphingomonas faeni]|nr:hypothetical protein [Sphingomonas faeni]MDQ0839221.1 hypothetical protein [Sphingomonas faeni]
MGKGNRPAPVSAIGAVGAAGFPPYVPFWEMENGQIAHLRTLMKKANLA